MEAMKVNKLLSNMTQNRIWRKDIRISLLNEALLLAQNNKNKFLSNPQFEHIRWNSCNFIINKNLIAIQNNGNEKN